MYTPLVDPFSTPHLWSEDIRLFDQAILASRADYKNEGILAEETLRLVLKDCRDMMDNPEALARMMRSNGTNHAHLALQLFLAQTANVQFPGQEPRPKEKIGRLVALLEALPRRHPGKIPRGHEQSVQEFLLRMEELLGASVTILATCFSVVMRWLAIAYLRSKDAVAIGIGNPSRFHAEADRQVRILSALLEEDALVDPFLVFKTSRLAAYLVRSEASVDFHRKFAHFLRLFSGSARELRLRATERPEFQVGQVSSRLSPLERYPIVRIEQEDGEHELIIPNVSHFLKSFSAVVDYTLLSAFGDNYNQVRGTLLEIYIRCLIDDQLPHLLVIPETAYGREERRGPDLTLIDRELGRIILVEVKGRRILLSTRIRMREEELRQNLAGAHEALLGLPRKLQDLYAGLPEYQDYQDAIDSTRNSEPIFVAVLSEGVYFMGELARELGNQPGDPLYGYPHRYCVLALDIFERAVEVARRRGEPLAVLLSEHWQRSLRREYEGPGADSFGGSHVPESETYAAGFAPWFEDEQR